MVRLWADLGTNQPIPPDMGSRSTVGLKLHLENHEDLYEKWQEARQTKKNGRKTKSLGDNFQFFFILFCSFYIIFFIPQFSVSTQHNVTSRSIVSKFIFFLLGILLLHFWYCSYVDFHNGNTGSAWNCILENIFVCIYLNRNDILNIPYALE